MTIIVLLGILVCKKMCLPDCLTVKMDIFRWRRKKSVGSNMDSRFGDPSISAPTQGSWNETSFPQSRRIDLSPLSNKSTGLKNFKRSPRMESPESSNFTKGTSFPRHPMVGTHIRHRSISADRFGDQDREQIDIGKIRQSPGPKTQYPASCDSLSCLEDEDELNPDSEKTSGTKNSGRPSNNGGSPSQDKHGGMQRNNDRREGQLSSTYHKPPPLSATALMRRYSSQSESTRTYTSTLSTATFSSRRTSVTTPGMHGFPGPSIPPLLKEEYARNVNNDVPPIPPIPKDRNENFSTSSSTPPSASRSVFREHNRGGNSNNKRRNVVPVGPQEMVPSQDELWGY